MKGLIKYSLLFSLIFSVAISFGQSRKELEKQKKRLQKDIANASEILKETKRNKQLSMTELVILNNKISKREKLIAAINKEVRILNKQIKETNALIVKMQGELKQLKEEYADMVYYSYKNRSSYDKLMFVFASDDFNQAYKRLKYYQQYSEYREKQAKHIQKTQEILNKKAEELKANKAEKQHLLGIERDEKSSLAAERQEQNQTLSKLQDDEKKLKAQIKKKEKEAAKLRKAIQRIIEEEIERAKKASAKGSYTLTPEAQALSNSFAKNKGKLPWPIEKGIIVEKYGEHPHPVLKEIKIKNNGININTSKGAATRAVFGGEVSGVVVIPGAGKAIMVRHGEYLTVYSNLKESYVQKGDKVTVKQPLGLIVSDDEKTQLHFELWKGKTILNPSDWIYKAK